jgi:hypothetical protein
MAVIEYFVVRHGARKNSSAAPGDDDVRAALDRAQVDLRRAEEEIARIRSKLTAQA